MTIASKFPTLLSWWSNSYEHTIRKQATHNVEDKYNNVLDYVLSNLAVLVVQL